MSLSIYQHKDIEEKWLSLWESEKLFQNTQNRSIKPSQEKEYLLFAFAYPSGSGLHVGHVESKTALDMLARFQRMNQKDVYFPVGWDAFGLPAENYAIKTGIHPAVTTKNAINTFRSQVKRLGISYDWENEIATSHPGYYQWTQWLFLQLYKKGLAYRGKGMVNWCPSCQTVLANEQVVDGKCERCGTQVIQKELEQWYFKITQYTEELISGLETVDWPKPTKEQQLHWIGKSHGLQVDFSLENTKIKLPIWTKFWETIYGVTFLVIAPEKFQQLSLEEHLTAAKKKEVAAYIKRAYEKTEEDRQKGEKEKSGVDTGLKVINPANGESVPLYVADYVLMNVGTAIVMGVPAHDQRDFDFAQKHNLSIRQVISFADASLNQQVAKGLVSAEGNGPLVNSAQFDGKIAREDGKKEIAEWLIDQEFARWQTTYKLRDWLISRQRYWGAPIPIVYDPEGKAHPVKEEHLPWMLPTDVDFKPTGESPLKSSKEFFARTEKLYGKGWTPECDTMDTFVDSSWYFLRYLDSRNTKQFADPKKLAAWLPVDLYLIGPEHIVLHLLYSRFFTKFLRDEGYLKIDEPFQKMRHQGMILGPDGKKMSKSKGNVINPDEIIEKFGSDTLRMYEMFMGPLESDKPWDTGSVIGVYRLVSRIYALSQSSVGEKGEDDLALLRSLHILIRKISSDLPLMKFNTAIAAIMVFVNAWEKAAKESKTLSRGNYSMFVRAIAPFAPFLTEELYQEIKHKLPKTEQKISVHLTTWPVFDEQLAREDRTVLVIQIDGKVRAQMEITPDQSNLSSKHSLIEKAKKLLEPSKWLEGKEIVKEIYIPGKIINFVTK